MTAHSAHFHSPASRMRIPILEDDCPRCAEQAEQPFTSLDGSRFGALWRRMVEVEKTPPFEAGGYASRTEARACRQLHDVAVMIERTQQWIDPWVWPWRVMGPFDGD